MVRPMESRTGVSTQWDFTQVVDATLPALSRYALRRAPTQADAEDVVAETYAIAWRKRQQIPAQPDTLPWLYGVARRVLANSRRSGNRWDRLRAKVGGQRNISAAPAPDAIVEHQPVHLALAQLPDQDREVLRLLAWEQLSQAEVAVVMGTSENAIALRASRARKKLAEILDKADRSDDPPDMEGRATGEEER